MHMHMYLCILLRLARAHRRVQSSFLDKNRIEDAILFTKVWNWVCTRTDDVYRLSSNKGKCGYLRRTSSYGHKEERGDS